MVIKCKLDRETENVREGNSVKYKMLKLCYYVFSVLDCIDELY